MKSIFESVHFLNEGILSSFKKKKKIERTKEEIDKATDNFAEVVKPYLKKMCQIIRKEKSQTKYKHEARYFYIEDEYDILYDPSYNEKNDSFQSIILSVDLWDIAPNNAREYYSSDCPANLLFYQINDKLKEYISTLKDIHIKIINDDGDWDSWYITIEIPFSDCIKNNRDGD